MELEKAKQTAIDTINKVIYLNDSVELRHGDKFVNRDGNIMFIDFSESTPRMNYFDDDGIERYYGEFSEYGMGNYAKIETSLEELDNTVFDIMMGKRKIEEFKLNSSSDESQEESTQLVHLKSADSLVTAKQEMEKQQNFVKSIHNRLQGILDKKRHQLLAVVEEFKYKLEKINKVLYTIELYLGVDEDVVQLTEGIKAPIDSPICLRQQILYMDEEIGIYENGGLGFQDMPKFDEWISDHFKELLPEEKGVVVFRVRRYKKDYGDRFDNAINGPYDNQTYFLIRNGDNLYRILANIVVNPRLFPLRSEISDIYAEIESPHQSFKESKKKNLDSLVLQYQRNSLVLQGIIDRTDIFAPIPQGINIFNPDSYGNTIKLIYDEENLLPSGRLPFILWRKEINSQIQRGSRILYHYDWNEMQEKYISDRFFGYRKYYPKAPQDGSFTVEDVLESQGRYSSKNAIKILFTPNSYYFDEPKKRMAFKLFSEDWFILNYDKISLEDLDYYINSRIDRPNYLQMLPMLIEAKKNRIKELNWEKEFVRMTVEELLRENFTVKEEDVWEAVNWWKNKVIWKRPITKDDAKALRMIKSKLKKELM